VKRYQFAFVLEQALGHTVHGMNLESSLLDEPDIDALILRVRPRATPGVKPFPWVNNWSLQVSWQGRSVLRAAMQSRHIDCVFIHTQVAALFAKGTMRRVPTVVSLDATPVNFDSVGDAYGHHRQAALVEHVKLLVNRRALCGASAIVTWSQWAADSVSRHYKVPANRVHHIFPGVQLSRFAPHSRDYRGPVRLLFVGADFVRKGGPDLIAAAGALGESIELDIVTSSASEITDAPGVTMRVHRDVKPNSARMSDLYGRADIFVLPSRGDCTPLVLAEAMASGLPVVATTVGAIPDAVRHGQNGLLVPPCRPDELTGAIRHLVDDAQSRQQMGAAGRLLAEVEHDTKANCQRIFDLMRSLTLLRGHSSRGPSFRSHQGSVRRLGHVASLI
jgi:glycosyltransferase involved in cell wall biosynthesis